MIFEKGDLITRRFKLSTSLVGVGIVVGPVYDCVGYSTIRVLWLNTGIYIDEYCDGLILLQSSSEHRTGRIK
jgi:hypothetical protein